MDTDGMCTPEFLVDTISLCCIETQVEPPQGSVIATSAEQRAYSRDLHEQLTTHHDTHFLAALIFISFFFSVSASPGEENLKITHPPDVDQREEPDNSRKMIVWDYAVAAIALAVKVQAIVYLVPGSPHEFPLSRRFIVTIYPH